VKPTYRLLGQVLKVAPSTVKRWFKPGEFEREAERWARSFDKQGKLIPIDKRQKLPLRKK
jgi:hypothetical protein